MTSTNVHDAERMYGEAETSFAHWEVLKDLVDEMIDLMLNYRQSGHPGGSRSKVHLTLALMLSGAMRWDILRPWRPFGDRFVLSAGHTVPLIYACLAVLNEAMRARQSRPPSGRCCHWPALSKPKSTSTSRPSWAGGTRKKPNWS